MVYSRTYREESIHMNTKTRKIAATGMLCALTYVVMAVGRVPVVLFLKYDPSDIVVTLGGLIWGPMTAFTVSAVVAVIEMLTVSDTGILGCIMNVVQTVSFACTAALIYRRRRTLGGAVAGLLTGCAAMVAVMMLWNYFLTPLYMGYPREAVAALLLPAFLPFNLQAARDPKVRRPDPAAGTDPAGLRPGPRLLGAGRAAACAAHGRSPAPRRPERAGAPPLPQGI